MTRTKSRITPRGGLAHNNTSYRGNLSSSREYANEGRNVKEEQSPFSFPSCSQTLAHLQWWKARKKMIIERSKKIPKKQYKYEPLRTHDILERLHMDIEKKTEEAQSHSDKIIAMTDVDPQYFTELSGRPVKEKFSLNQYIQDTRYILKTKLLIGQEKDDCIRIAQQFEHESRRLQNVQNCARRYVSGFEEFLSRDHKKSVDMLEKAVEETKLTEEIRARRNELSKKFGQIRLDVYFWEENWKMVKMCQMFLYQVSPLPWRIKYDRAYQSESKKSISLDTAELFSRYKASDEAASLETLIDTFEQDIADAGPAELYFHDPFDLIHVFRAMEEQNLNALIHLESLAAPMADMAKTITATEAQMKQEIGEISSTIDDLESVIVKTENRAVKLEEYANYLLRGIFQHLVCSEEVLYLRVFVEDTYESCVGPNDANLDSFSMMKWIERTYEELNLQLDNLPHEIVRACEKEGFRQEAKAIREAEDAARKFELMHRLLDALKRIMEPPRKKTRPLVRRSTPVAIKTKPPAVSPKPTTEEAQYLAFFTDYCKRDDFVAYRAKFPDDFDLTFQSKHDDIDTETRISNDVSSNIEEKQERQSRSTV